MRNRIMLLTLLLIAGLEAMASTTSDELWIIAAGRGPGAAGSVWVTDLYVTNTGDDSIDVEISFIAAQSGVVSGPVTVPLDAGQTRAYPDLLKARFGLESAVGAIHVEMLVEDDDELSSDTAPLAAYARIYNDSQSGSFGQSIDGTEDDEAISAEGVAAMSWITGVTNDSSYRTNWFGLNLSSDEEDQPLPAAVLVEAVNAVGAVVASKSYSFPAGAPVFHPVSELAPTLVNGMLRFTMAQGVAVFGASMIDARTNDPTTLEASRGPARDQEFTDEFATEDCTFTSRGKNPFFRLVPGAKLVLEGEEDGETIRHEIEVLDETEMVDGVRTRVILETETADGEPIETSRNFFAECTQTQDVYYFGEEVDIYEDGEIVSHGGSWRAGVDGATAGIMMPGSVLAGARYFQEVAPEVALDRAEHLETGLDVETEIGEFEGCVLVRDTNALEPQAPGDLKIYCPGVGLVRDDILEIVEAVEGAAQ